ncbi:hypothetical protein [Macrococcus sp. S115]|nr:hypothetical protein [Macrococcus sp. S115]MDJ1112658.1 hypothetical protein [Macrococcus sp. S115]
MLYTDVYKYFEKLDENYYMGNFTFNGYAIRICLSTYKNNPFFAIICNMPDARIMKDIIYRQYSNGDIYINKQWNPDMLSHAMLLIEGIGNSRSFDPFYERLKEYILQEQLYISNKRNILAETNSTVRNKDNYIYYKTHRRTNMSSKQEAKCLDILGSSATNYLKSRRCTAVFTDNIFDKKDFKFDF